MSRKRTQTRLAAASNKLAQMKKSAAKRSDDTEAAGTGSKKLGLESSATRTALLDATEQLLREQGFAAITSRIIAAKAGLKPQLIHYYFNSMDDLYVEVFKRGAEADLARLNEAMDAEHPVRAMWKLSTDPKAARFITEYITIANHIEAVRGEISRYAKLKRELQAKIIARKLAAHGHEARIAPILIAFLLENAAKGFVLEAALDLTLGHAEAETFLDACLSLLENGGDLTLVAAPQPPSKARAKSAGGKPARGAKRKA